MVRVEAAIGLVAAATAAVGCGGGEATSDLGDAPSSATATSNAELDPEPAGKLLATGIGQVGQGASVDEVIELFGRPDDRNKFSGCEFNPGSSAVVQLTYELNDGSLALNFEATSDELASYRTDSSELATTLGDRVGESFRKLRANWGGSLTALDLGVESTPSSGTWLVEDGPTSELLFEIDDGTIQSISGGYLPICE